MRQTIIAVLLIAPVAQCAEEGLLSRWDLTPDGIKEGVVRDQAGKQDARVTGKVQFSSDEPRAFHFSGDTPTREVVLISKDMKTAALPKQAHTIEAWVWIDKTRDDVNIIGVMQDNGPYEKGWLLGYHHGQFQYGVATKKAGKLTYLRSRGRFDTGCWYHLVGTYDGKTQQIWVDGRLDGEASQQSGDIDYPPQASYVIGAYQDDNEFRALTGRVERVSIFDRALSGEEIRKIFNQRKARFPGIEPAQIDVTDWPMYQRDPKRRGISDEQMKLPLHLQWRYRTQKPPSPAWPEEAKHDYFNGKMDMPERVVFDRGFQLVGVGDRVFFASSAEDKVVCLDAVTGKERWIFRTGGPVRLAPTIVGDRVLFGCDDGHVYCLTAKDGALVWKQRLAPEERWIPGNERMISGWPVRTDVYVENNVAYVCAGVFPSQGVWQFKIDVVDGKVLDKQTLKVTAQGYMERLFGKLMIGTGRNPAGAFVGDLKASGKTLGKEVNDLAKDCPYSFIGAGDVRFAGGDGKIAAFSRDDGKLLWTAAVDGKVWSLMVVRGRLYASTDKGAIYCFAPTETPKPFVHTPMAPTEPFYRRESEKDRYSIAVLRTQLEWPPQRGYCLVLGSEYGHFIHELAKVMEWQFVVVEPDEKRVATTREVLDAAGHSGRVTVIHGPVDNLPFNDCTFNVVLGDWLVGGETKPPRAEILRVLRPEGGIAILGSGEKDIVRRGKLEGAGEWSHPYADPSNTACSNDRLVGSELRLQWFGKPGPRQMIDRHHRTAPPVYRNGLLFVSGEDRVTCVDAYNGTIHWERDIPNSRRVAVFRDSSHLVAGEKHTLVVAANECLGINPQTGKTERNWVVPEGDIKAAYDWGYLANLDDIVIGSAVKQGSIRRTQSKQISSTETHRAFISAVGSDFVFAYRTDGKLRWKYQARSGLIVNPSFSIGDGKLFFIESDNSTTMTSKLAQAKIGDLMGKGSRLVALDWKTGNLVWSRPLKELTSLQHIVYTSVSNDRLAIVGTRDSGPDKKKDHVIYEILVLNTKNGEKVWAKSQVQSDPIDGDHGEHDHHPAIVGTTLFVEPRAYDLQTGVSEDAKWPWANRKRAGCGTVSASANCFFYRDNTATAYDLQGGKSKPITAETRPGCWINLIPAGGLLLAPEASSGCSCNYSVQTSLALIPVPAKR